MNGNEMNKKIIENTLMGRGKIGRSRTREMDGWTDGWCAGGHQKTENY